MSVIEEDQRLMRKWLASGSLEDKKAWLDYRCNSYFFNTPSGNLEVQVRIGTISGEDELFFIVENNVLIPKNKVVRVEVI